MQAPPRVLLCLALAALATCFAATAYAVGHARPHRTAAVAAALGPAPEPAVQVEVAASRQDAPSNARRVIRLTPPDVAVELSRPVSTAAVHRLAHAPGVRRVAVLDVGHVRLGGRRLHVAGVDPVQLRPFTPALTAGSDALWSSVGRGELTVAYSYAQHLRRALGRTLAVHAPAGRLVALRLGAFASLGLGRSDALVTHAVARELGLQPRRVVLVSAPRLAIGTVAAESRRYLHAPRARVHVLRPPPVPVTPVSAFARESIPPAYLALYQAAARTCPGLPWTVLAGIGAVETRHGADLSRSSKGARGPMQFLPTTFAAYAVDGNGDGVANIDNPADAVFSAARLLCLDGAGRGGRSLYDAIWDYNHADWYVREVLAYAVAYA
jgi:hypothetical protein